MKLRLIVTLIIGITLLGLLGALYGIISQRAIQDYAQLNQRYLDDEATRVSRALEGELAELESAERDWANWDDTYLFAQGQNPGFVELNLGTSSLAILRLNIFLVFDASGRLVHSQALDWASITEQPLPPGLDPYLTPTGPWLSRPDLAQGFAGITVLPEGPLMVAAQPIFDSHSQGPSAGTLIWGRFLDAAEVQSLAEQTASQLQVLPYDSSALPADFLKAQAALSAERLTFSQSLDPTTNAIYWVVNDLLGPPGLIFRVAHPNDIYQQGLRFVGYLLTALLVAGVVYVIVALVSLELLVVGPLGRLTREVMQIGARQAPGGRVAVPGRAEIRDLGNQINQMLAALEKTQADLHQSEVRYREVVDNQGEGLVYADAQDRFVFTNPAADRIFGVALGELTGRDLLEFIPPDQQAALQAQTDLRRRGEQSAYELEIRRADGQRRTLLVTALPRVDEAGQFSGSFAVLRDITERKQHEREQVAMVEIASALRTAETPAEMFPIILDKALDLLKAEGSALAMHEPMAGKIVVKLGIGGWTKLTSLRIPPGQSVCGQVIATGRPHTTNDLSSDPDQYRPDLFGNLNAVVCVPLIAQDETIGSLLIGRVAPVGEPEQRLLTAIADIAANAIHRAILYERTEQHLQRLSALRTIDAAINSSQDLSSTLYTILEQTKAHLRVDAAALLLFDRQSQTLDYAAGRGFRGTAVTRTQLQMGESHAGRAAQERRLVRVLDLAEPPLDHVRAALVSRENFVSYYGMPLVSKGQVRGVLEIFNRSPLASDPEWEDFLEALAGQAAIAIENAGMIDELQRANQALTEAYDATIEGWARSLELRDRTPGHTQRVTGLTMRLAQALGVNEANLVHIRRGAIMHDIGKLSLSDALLTKAEPLTSQEAEIMQHHTQNAYKILTAIPYLRPALDIPYCHHERWDGSGYPRGLAADQIPLAARIFAVVDQWDELRYRKSLPEDQVRAQLQSLSGSDFDPAVVDVFLKLEII